MQILRYRLITILFAATLFSSIGTAQFPDFKFNHINENQNLSHSSVLNIVQDNEGFLWFATIDGLNRFDGYTCKVFKHHDGDSTSISSNFIHRIYIDTDGEIWITTRDGGLNKFDKYTEKFMCYRHNPNLDSSISSDKAAAILQDKKGNYWVSSDGGLDRFYPQTGKFVHINLNEIAARAPEPLDQLYIDESGLIWICSLNGLIKFNPENLSFIKYENIQGNLNSLNDDFIHFVYREANYLWLTTGGGGLTQFDIVNDNFKVYYPSFENKRSVIFGSILPYSDNILIIGSEGHGLFFFDKNTKRFHSIKNNPENSNSISNNHISSIFKDNQQNIWIGTWGGGINKVTNPNRKFIKYSNNPFDQNSISGTSVFAIYKDNSGDVWVGTSNGLDRLDKKSGKFVHYNFNNNKNVSLGANIYGAIYCDRKNNFWFSSGTLIRYNIRNNKTQIFHYEHKDTNTISSNNIKCIVGDKKGNIWLGVEEGVGGICKYDIQTQKWTRYLSNPQNPLLVRYIYEAPNGVFWLATTNSGLIKFDVSSGKKTVYKNDPDNLFSISYNDVRHIIETENGELWVATYGGGIDRFDPVTEKFYRIKEKDGLSNNFTYAILEDKNENLWISTNFGLTKFNRKDTTFKVYTIEDGLQNNEFNTGAFYKSEDGELFFGGVNGFNRFYPEKISENKKLPPVYITAFKLLDKEIKPDTSVIFNKNITLSYFDKFFSVEFVALDYRDPSKNQYKYKLEGFDDDWIKADHRRYASYTNLSPGHYVLKIIASNNDGVWNKKGTKLNITVTPPFWLEWWFILSSVVILLIIMISTVRYYSTRKLKEQIYHLEKERAVQTERERISRDLHDNVGSQLTNIITGIGLAEIYNKSEKKKADSLLTSLKGELRETMTQLRETIWALKSNEMDFESFITELRKLIERHQKFFSGKIQLELKSKSGNKLILKPLQTLYVLRIIQEAITNSIKHSGADKIVVSILNQDNRFTVFIQDNGKGINEINSDLLNGNGIVNMKKRAEEIGGDLKINTTENEGVKISVIIPV